MYMPVQKTPRSNSRPQRRSLPGRNLRPANAPVVPVSAPTSSEAMFNSQNASAIQAAQRVAVFVDVQNVYYSARALFKRKANFGHILKSVVGPRSLIRALAYVIKAGEDKEEQFFDALKKSGYEICSKDIQVFLGGLKKGDWDVGIAMDIIRLAPKVDAIVLVSGDGDYQPLLEYVKALGCRAEVAAFSSSASSKLIEEADSFLDLSKDPSFLLAGSSA